MPYFKIKMPFLIISSFFFLISCSTHEPQNRSEFLSKHNITELKLIGESYLNLGKVYLTLELDGNSEEIDLNSGDYYTIKHGDFNYTGQNSSLSFKHNPEVSTSVKLFFADQGLAHYFVLPPFDGLNASSLSIDNKQHVRLEFSNLSKAPSEVELGLKCYDTQDSTLSNIRDFEIIQTLEDNIGKVDFSGSVDLAKKRLTAPNCRVKADLSKTSSASSEGASLIGFSTLTLRTSMTDSLIFIP